LNVPSPFPNATSTLPSIKSGMPSPFTSDSLSRTLRSAGFSAITAAYRSELRRFRNLTREARAFTNSYLTAVIESQETDEARRLFRKRIRREKAED
jgi:hypothetical protein